MTNHPYYIVDFSAVHCFLEIRVNDVSVFSLNLEGQVSTIVPINDAILETGKQQVSYNILPLLGETVLRSTASFSASVWIYDASGEEIQKQDEITTFTMPENKTGFPLPVFRGESFFWANVPYKLDAWQNSQNLKDIEGLKRLLVATYRKIEQLINNKQYDQFARMIQKREENIAVCMYFSEKEKEERITELVNIIETGFEVVPVSDEDIMIFYGYGKLANLIKPNKKSALLLRNEEEGEEMELELRFHLPPDATELSII